MPKQHKLIVRPVRREHPDVQKLSRALLALALEQAAAEAAAQRLHEQPKPKGGRRAS